MLRESNTSPPWCLTYSLWRAYAYNQFSRACACVFIGASISTNQTTGAEACGTCTLTELYGIMTRVGSDLFPCGQEDLEALAVQCGIMDGCVWRRMNFDNLAQMDEIAPAKMCAH